MIQITGCAAGCVLPVRAQPGARRTGIVGEHHGALRVAVAAPPDKGKANAALQEVLCQALHLSKSQVELLTGAASRDKRFLLRGVKPQDVLEQLHTILQKS